MSSAVAGPGNHRGGKEDSLASAPPCDRGWLEPLVLGHSQTQAPRPWCAADKCTAAAALRRFLL